MPPDPFPLARAALCTLGLLVGGVAAAGALEPAEPRPADPARVTREARDAPAARGRPPLGAAFPGTAPVDRVDPYAAMLARLPERASRAIGTPGAGRLRGGVPFPAAGPDHLTWDPITKGRPSRAWRRVGTARTVRRTLRALHALRQARPGLGRLLVGDLSRPEGGDFGARFGIIGHRTHQNGRDVDVYFPLADGRSAVATGAAQVDQGTASALVRALLTAGAKRVLVGPGSGPRVRA